MSLSRIVEIVRVAADRTRTASGAGKRSLLPSIMSSFPRRQSPFVPELVNAEVEALKTAVGNVRAEELGIDVALLPLVPVPVTASKSPITYIPVAENTDMLMAIFVLPPGAVIPTHSHPFMHVFSSVLAGELHVVEYDMLSPPSRYLQRRYDGIAVRRPVSVSYAGDVRVLSPSVGNIHSFHAKAWTVVFDLAVPPYSSSSSRACRYFDSEHISANIKGVSLDSLGPADQLVYLKVSYHVAKSIGIVPSYSFSSSLCLTNSVCDAGVLLSPSSGNPLSK
jgi:PCO_ADO